MTGALTNNNTFEWGALIGGVRKIESLQYVHDVSQFTEIYGVQSMSAN